MSGTTIGRVVGIVSQIRLSWSEKMAKWQGSRHACSLHVLCTTLPLFTAFIPRLLMTSRALTDTAMSMFGKFATLGQGALVTADLVALALSIWDWRANHRLNVFPVVLALLLGIHVATVTLYRLPLWGTFVTWFVNLPLP